jgi:quercetin dioxygenase-like cupin family protein
VPNHNHTSDETIIWLKGPFTYVNGVDGKSKEMSGQAFASLPGNATPHSVRCGAEPCMFYLRFTRGFDYKIHPMPEKLTKMN